ncbi:uncharacterized protein Z518_00213 [Rhinocladiella mackenziei CBS 650.93]|uniref:Transcriptional regulatory protein n=1 Tax=Rhinocladiella mackenziei CBS 650.93 TaxID=1442369 RepID=A0A0D2JIB4_9EURO|nr:uncharacterized protein Z518_00213 [Rhinocladiella mackenziei CBS 650.93]KIX09135.1 hypothetical protein Z518_00213 [Rhinocladiella mackenziei CBS 650.93]
MSARHLGRPCLSFRRYQAPCRHWSSSSRRRAGHSRWTKIRHDKGNNDKVKAKARTQLSHDIIIATKFGGPDPTFNSKLAIAIANAKKGQLSKTSIEHAIAKGQGKSPTGQELETITIEALLPHGVAAIIECQTDNKARTLSDIRLIVNRAGGTITPTMFLFEKKGIVTFEEQDQIKPDDALDEAIDAGALDIISDENKLVVETSPTDIMAVTLRLQERLGLRVEKSEVVYVPHEESMVTLSEEQEQELQKILDTIEEDPSSQNLYINAA